MRRGDGGFDVGRAGERVAERYLRRLGYRLLGRNVRVAGGELDLVMTAPDGVTVVVVEVKSRIDAGAGGPRPEANVTRAKMGQLVKLSGALVASERLRGRPVRIDVVAVEFDARTLPSRGLARRLASLVGRGPRATVRHLPAAVTGASVTGSRR